MDGCGVLIDLLMVSFANWACRSNLSVAVDAAWWGVELVVVVMLVMVGGGVSVLWLVD